MQYSVHGSPFFFCGAQGKASAIAGRAWGGEDGRSSTHHHGDAAKDVCHVAVREVAFAATWKSDCAREEPFTESPQRRAAVAAAVASRGTTIRRIMKEGLAISREAAARYARPADALVYGTAGFRARAELLDSTFFRMGMLAALRSRSRGGLAVGLMVTASHNPEPDNGIKLVDFDGGMLHRSWERHATALANAPDDAVVDALSAIGADEGFGPYDGPATVLLGRDTRPHSERLAAIAAEGVELLRGDADERALLTTPQLHHLVRMANGERGSGVHYGRAAWGSEDGYYAMIRDAFVQLRPDPPPGDALLWVDCAHGVGAPKLRRLGDTLGGALRLTIANDVGTGELNAGCGAEHVQKGRTPPRGFEAPLTSARRACSLDGDADRIVFHYWTEATAGPPPPPPPSARAPTHTHQACSPSLHARACAL